MVFYLFDKGFFLNGHKNIQEALDPKLLGLQDPDP
jgi:hypothetical protein